MTNPYYNHGSFPATNSAGASASMRAELDAITAGFNKLPATLTANNVVFINSSGTALEARAGIDGIVIGGTTPAAGSFTTLTLSSALVLPAGSVGAPGAAFVGDTNNGWWAPAADTQAWSIAGAEAVRLNATGFGIGTSPSNLLHLNAASGSALIRFSDSTPRTLGFLGSGSGIISTAAAADLGLRAEANLVFASLGNNERMRIDTSGNVGIGTSSPQKRFVIANGTAAGLEISPTDYAGNMRMLAFDRTAAGYVALRMEASQYEVLIGGTEALRIDSSRNFAFGTSTTTTNRVLVRHSGAVASPEGSSGLYINTGPGAGAAGVLVGADQTNNVAFIQSIEPATSYSSKALSINPQGGSVIFGASVPLNVGFGVTPLRPLHIKSATSEIVRLETTTARGSGQIALAFLDPTGQKGYFGYGSANDTLQIFNGLGAIDFYSGGAGPFASLTSSGVFALYRAGIGLQHSVSLPGGIVEWDLINTSNTANSQTSLFMQVAGAAAGDNFIRMNINAVQDWTFGVDNSDADAFVFAASSSLGSGNILKLGTGSVVDIVGGSGKLNIGAAITRFESAEQSVPTTTFASNAINHNGPRVPDVSRLVLRCKTAELGYSVGDEVDVTLHNHTMTDRAFNVWHSTTQTGYVWITGLNVAPSISHKTTGTMTTVTAANWRVVVYNHWL